MLNHQGNLQLIHFIEKGEFIDKQKLHNIKPFTALDHLKFAQITHYYRILGGAKTLSCPLTMLHFTRTTQTQYFGDIQYKCLQQTEDLSEHLIYRGTDCQPYSETSLQYKMQQTSANELQNPYQMV
ncbi:hypothetical protein XELAEV_18018078mg [Xenopus laevis]|uniref:Uncharacterized protein n=1 Tax=Xenopus laevis TaxID=8355 RepID=A0A974DF45_XENLA|nr:hypothetical protein XELAEV_18018078mg [Xenopus laevis]